MLLMMGHIIMDVGMRGLRHSRLPLSLVCLSNRSSRGRCSLILALAHFAGLGARCARGLGLGEPIVELLLRHNTHRDRHEGVVASAELRALAVVPALALGPEPGGLQTTRCGAGLA